jgi:hypothetical protein
MKRWLAVGWMLLCAAPGLAYEIEQKPYDLSLSAGLLSSGSIEAAWHSDFKPGETLSFVNLPSTMIRALADYYLHPNVAIGGALTYAAIIPEHAIDYYDSGWHHIARDDIHILDYCFAIKGRFVLSNLLAVKPGLYLGGRSSFSSAPEARETGVALNGGVEFQFFLQDNYYVLVDTGFIAQPYGGVGDVAYIRGGPIFYFCLGLGL